jgi:hypothetical protein
MDLLIMAEPVAVVALDTSVAAAGPRMVEQVAADRASVSELQLIVQQVLQELVDQEHIQHQHQADQAKLIIHLVQVQQAVQEQTVVMGL